MQLTYAATRPLTAARPRFPALTALYALYRQRQALRALDDTRLADLGLTRAEANAESRRPVWDVPANWRG